MHFTIDFITKYQLKSFDLVMGKNENLKKTQPTTIESIIYVNIKRYYD